MILARFPFRWGAPTVIIPEPPPPPPFWVKDTPGPVVWHAREAVRQPRFQHIYPADTNILWTKKDAV